MLLAYVIEIGPGGTFLSLGGLIESELVGDEFDFAIAPDQGFGDDSVVTALLQDGTRIFGKTGIELDESEIVPETGAQIDGVFSFSDDTLFKTALLILDIEPEIIEVLRGQILAIDDAARRLALETLEDDILADECVDVPEDADVFLIRRTTTDRSASGRRSRI